MTGSRQPHRPAATLRTPVAVALAAALVAAPSTPSVASAGPWVTPLVPLHLASRFDPPARDWLPGHRGVDLVSEPGDIVRAAGPGVVTFARDLAGRGVVSLDHGSLRTTYEPIDARVAVGQHVAAGAPIGTSGTGTGHCGTGRCVHVGLIRGGQYLNPLLLFGPRTALLRPW